MSTIEDLFLRMLRHWLPYYLLAWVAVGIASFVAIDYSWHTFDKDNRNDGNSGHATIDFGGQYLMGKMLLTGNGHQLYNRHVQRVVLQGVYDPRDWDYPPDYPYAQESKHGDVEDLMTWTMGDDQDGPAKKTLGSLFTPLAAADPWQAAAYVMANEEEWTEKGEWAEKRFRTAIHPVGGPLYPPVGAFVNAPFALVPVHAAYRVQQLFNLFLVFVAAAGGCYLARGRVWWPILAFAIMVFPGFSGSLNLGQNATLTLTIIIWGWALTARGRPISGGMVWGLLAFKPVWALAFFLVPLLSRRWRMCLAMIGSGVGLCLLTLPFVGLQSWLDWLRVGKEAADLYDIDRNWIFLSRDLFSIMRRSLMDFELGVHQRLPNHHFWLFNQWWVPLEPALKMIGWMMMGFVLENTVRLAVLRRRQATAPDGPPAAFLFLAAWMCCFHFMYYDALLAAPGLFLLWTEPRRYISPLLVTLGPLHNESAGRSVVAYHQPGVPPALPPPVAMEVRPRAVWTLNRLAPTVCLMLLLIHYAFPKLGWGDHDGRPWETYLLAGVWLWCGWQWLRHGEKVAASWSEGEPAEPEIDVKLFVVENRNGQAAPSDKESIRPALPDEDAS